ncbi:galactose-binding domain-like protein [Diaporthe sp. PMI_573]|nr:galactose-binding domain-like protein [Diaporthaceae sp. PMI_573]
MTARPIQRGYCGALFDRLTSWLEGLPTETCSYTITPVKIPLTDEDDVQLAADLYTPLLKNNEAPKGTILMQCPYGRRLLALSARSFAPRGYIVLFVSVRGTFGSGGEFDPARIELQDGPRVVEWMRRQPWYTGSFATIGASYLAYVQWALISGPHGPPDDMAAAIPSVGPHDFARLLWGTGALWLTCVDWARNMSIQESQSLFSQAYGLFKTDLNTHADVKKSVPLLEGARSYFKGKSPWLLEWIARPDWVNDPFYDSMKQEKALRTSKVPILLIGGWQDVFSDTVMEQYQRLRESGCTVGLTVGPWNHLQAANGEGVTKESLEWLDKYLAKRKHGEIRPAPVRINVTGANEWRWLPSWPPATTPLELSLYPQGRLVKQHLDKRNEASFTFDPHDPTPTMGGPLLFHGGVVDDTALAKRSDVLTFTTTPLDHGVEVLGKAHIELAHSSDSVHADLFVRLSEVDVKGVSHNVTQVYKRLETGRAKAGQTVKVELDLADCAHRFNKGTCIRILVAGGNFPLYSFNLGTGEDQGTGTAMKPVTHTLQLGGEYASKLVLPVSYLD